jgi:hypothetical protein
MITANIHSLYAQTPVLMIFTAAVIMIALTILIRRGWWKEHPGQYALLAGLTVQCLLLFAVVLKHPGGLYLLSIAATLPVMIIIIFQYLSEQSRAIVILTQVISVGIILGALWNLRSAINSHSIEVTGLDADQYQIDRYISDYAESIGVGERDVVVLYSYGIYDRCYSLLFGDNYVGSPLNQELSRICPMRLEVNIWNQRIRNGNEFVPLDSMEWDLLFTREYLLTEFPFLQAMGVAEQIETSENFLPYGHLQVIRRVQ